MAKNEGFFEFIDFTKQSLGLEESVVERFAQDLSRNFGGESVYITSQWDRMNRDKSIRKRYDGSNADALAEEYHISRRLIFYILNSG